MTANKRTSIWIIIALSVGAGLLCLIVMQALYKTYVVQAFRMPSGSMIPTLLIGDHFLTDKTYANKKKVERGDILIFKYPKDQRKMYVKRVIGLPGDSIEIKDKKIYINNELIEEPYAIHTDRHVFAAHQNPRDNLGPVVVPDSSYFMMGDNRDRSNDSRFWGFLHSSNIKGRAGMIYWSWDNKNSRVRWNRIGKSIYENKGL